MSELKPCPFCGEQVFPPLASSFDDSYTRCGFCGAKMQRSRWQTRPIEDALRKRIAELEAVIEILEDQQREAKNILIDKNLHIDSLYEEGYKLQQRIAELEAENDQLTAHDATERHNDNCSKPEPNVCEACGGDGTVLLTDGYKGQVIATAKCIYCNGTGRVNKDREE